MTSSTMEIEDVSNVLSVMQKNLECPICLDIMKEPVATRCDHIFCRFCMLQLLSKKKKGRTQCPMCKKEVTKRSLQNSPRFKLLVDGLLKIINAFELDSGFNFFPSQDFASTVTASCKEAPKKNEQPVVQSTGYRNRTKQGTVNRGHCEDRLYLLEAGPDTQLTRDEDARNYKQHKHQKTETKELIRDFVLDSSEDDLFKKAGTLGCDVGKPSMSCEPRRSLEPEEKESLMTIEEKDQVTSKLESEDVAASDLAEYGCSEIDLESIRSNLLSIDGVGILKGSPTGKSEVDRDPLISHKDFCETVAEQRTHVKLDKTVRNTNLTEPESNMQIKKPQFSESQSLKIAIDYEYDRDNSTPENMVSTQGSSLDASSAMSRQRVKSSIKKVNEWLLKTDEPLYNCSLRGEELLPDFCHVNDLDASYKGSSLSEETEIMNVDHCLVANAVEKSMASVEDKIFGRVYKREKKTNVSIKVTCVADVHMDGVEECLKVNEVPQTSSLKPKRSTGLQPKHFIKKIGGKEESKDSIASDPVAVYDFGLDTESNQMKGPNATFLDADKIEFVGEDMEAVSDAQISKPEKQNKSLKRKSEKAHRLRITQSLHLIKGTDVASCQQQSPFHSSEVQIDSYSSTETGHEVNQRNVRRSKRLNLLKENETATNINSKDCKSGGLPTENHINYVPTLINCEEPCLQADSSEVIGPQIKSPTPIAVQKITGNESSHMEYDSAHVIKDMCKGSSPEPKQNTADMEDSDLDTQVLLKTFKSAKRMSFKLDPVIKTSDKENCNPMDICDVGTNLTNGQQDNDQKGQPSSLCKSNEAVHCTSQYVSVQENKPEHSRNLRSKRNCRLSLGQAKNTNNLKAHTTKTITTDGRLNDLSPIKDVEPLEKCNQSQIPDVSKSEGLQLHSESMSLYPVVAHQNPAAAMRGDIRSGIGQGENEQARNDSYQKCSFDEEQVNQISSSNSSQGSLTGKLLGHLVSHNSSPYKSPEVYSDTPDGLLSIVDRFREDANCGAVVEKSFVFGDGKKSRCSASPVTQSQVVRSRKRRAQKLGSSEEESSGDEELPCFNALFGNASTVAYLKNASASSSPKQQGGGVLAMFSSCSTSGKTQTSFSLPREALVGSQESQCSVNLFSSQSNISDNSVNGATGHNGMHSQHGTRESSPKRAKVGLCYTKEELANAENEEKDNVENEDKAMVNVENEDPCQEHNLGEVSGCESEASHTGDSSGLSSQCEILSTQQRDAMQNNLEKLQREMAALEAVLEQHGSQNPASGRELVSTAEHVKIRLQEVPEKQACYEAYRSPDAIPETEVQSEQGRASGLQNIEQPPPSGSQSRSTTPPLSPPRITSKNITSEKMQASYNLLKEESTLTSDGLIGQKEDSDLHAHEPDHCAPTAMNLKNSRSPKQILSELQEVNGRNTLRRERSKQSTELKEPSQHSRRRQGNTQRSSSPTFTSPLRSKVAPSFKSPVVSGKRNFSLVMSGLSQSEAILVHKFARKTESIFSSQLTESTTHVVMKTDEQLVCERTLKYFLGIAGRKWVISYEWIVKSFREGRILDEYDFEVKGDVINGRNHRGPRRSRLGSDGLLLTNFEICCLGSFKDMTRDELEWMVSLCGASVAKDPSQFEHKSETTSLVVVQPDKETDYAAMRKKYHCLVITREWVLDSVSSYKLQAFDSYLV